MYGRLLSLNEVAPIQGSELLRDKFTVATGQFSVEINFAAAVALSLDVDHVPMDLTAVAVVGFFVGLTGREME